MQDLGQFLKFNQKLIHVNISHTNLSRGMLLSLGPILRKSRSMLVLHASGNPGIAPSKDPGTLDEVRAALHERAHCAENIDTVHIDIGEQVKLGARNDGPNSLKAGLKLKKYNEDRARKADGRIPELENDIDKLVFERLINHKKDMPGAGQWRLLHKADQKCWICSNKVYSIVLWSK